MTEPRAGLPGPTRPGDFSARAMAAVVVGVALIAGILVGIGLDRAFFRPHRAIFAMVRGHHVSNEVVQQRRAEFARQLHLTPDQQARIDTIMMRRMSALDSIQRETRPRVRALIGATRAQIDSVLTPEQRDRFRSLLDRFLPHWRAGRALLR